MADNECNSKLILTHRTIWTNIDDNFKKQIIENRKATTHSSTFGFQTAQKPKELEFSNARQNDYGICTIQNDNLYLTNNVK